MSDETSVNDAWNRATAKWKEAEAAWQKVERLQKIANRLRFAAFICFAVAAIILIFSSLAHANECLHSAKEVRAIHGISAWSTWRTVNGQRCYMLGERHGRVSADLGRQSILQKALLSKGISGKIAPVTNPAPPATKPTISVTTLRKEVMPSVSTSETRGRNNSRIDARPRLTSKTLAAADDVFSDYYRPKPQILVEQGRALADYLLPKSYADQVWRRLIDDYETEKGGK